MRLRTAHILLAAVLTLFVSPCIGQTKESLSEQIRKAERQIQLNEKLLKQVTSDRTANDKQLKLVLSKIGTRQKLINSLNGQISLLEAEIDSKEREIAELNARLDTLKTNYSHMMYESYKNYKLSNALLFVFASKNFNDITRRLDYMKRYNRLRKSRGAEILSLSEQLRGQVDTLAMQVTELDASKSSRSRELTSLKADQETYSTQSKALSKKLSSISSTIKQFTQQKEKAQRELQKIIEEEARKSGKATSTLTEEQRRREIELSGKFDQNKGRLPLPVNGIIIDHFGVHKHPTQSNLTVNNKGVNIAAEKGATVYSVFEGTVSRVFFINGLNNCVMIKHGEYFTVYSNLASVSVRAGDSVTLNQKLGSIPSTGGTDDFTLHFELWKGTVNLDPELWLD